MAFVTEAVRASLAEREKALIAACDAVNADAQLNSLTDEWQAVEYEVEERWNEPSVPSAR